MKHVLLVLLLCVCGVSHGATQGIVYGNTTAVEAQSSGFFKFFALVRADERPSPQGDGKFLEFTTSGQFSGSVFVLIEVGKEHQIRTLTAIIKRSFIDSPATTEFARDFAKSFLLFATPKSNNEKVIGLVREIWTSDPPGATRYVNKGGHFQRATSGSVASDSAEYQTFLGKRNAAVLKLSDSKIVLKNVGGSGETALLEISVGPLH
jgi:hypothetical protein